MATFMRPLGGEEQSTGSFTSGLETCPPKAVTIAGSATYTGPRKGR
jgi:hypothetical protein